MKIAIRANDGAFRAIAGDSLRVYVESERLAAELVAAGENDDEGYVCHFNFTPEGMMIDMVGSTSGEVYRTFGMMWEEVAYDLCK